jgi:ankyrin repeat protein
MDDLTVDEELYTIVCQGDLSNELDARLKSLPDVDKTLQYLYERDDQNFNLLMLAALYGHDVVVRVILSHSSNVKNLVELFGSVQSIDGNLEICVTALWCACDRGHYTVARTLIELGNARVYYGPRNPLLIDAIINERFDTIQFLIENGYVDIDRTKERDHPNYNSLVLSAARGQTKIVAYLIEKGAEIDYKTQVNDTALGCAAMHGHLDTVQFLCSAGASTNIKNNNGESPLILAFENGHSHIVDYLLDLTSNELCIEELELIACSFIVPTRSTNNDRLEFIKMVNLMQRIFQMRKTRNSPKSIAKPIAAYNFQQECQTIEEFEKIKNDHNRLYIEALLIRERILMPKKIQALCDPLLTYGQKLVEQNNFELCLHLWEHTFYLYQNMGHETSLHRFVWIFCKMLTTNTLISPQLFVQICRLTFQPAEQNKKNHSVKNALCLATIAAKVNPFFLYQQFGTRFYLLTIQYFVYFVFL